MYHGHDPRDIDAYPWRDVHAFLTVYPEILTVESPFQSDP